MPVLKNPRHERFAQELAKGVGTEDAYVIAGFKRSRANANTLRRGQAVSSRVAEILEERAAIHTKGVERAIERTAVDKAWVLMRLQQNVERAMTVEEVRDAKGHPTGEYRYEGSVANRALELLGKEIGMFIERRESGRPGEFANEMTEAELATIARRGGNGVAATDTGTPKSNKLH